MEKDIIGNVVTGNEELLLEFVLGKKKTSVEQLFIESPVVTSSNNTNNLIKSKYNIEDDYDEDVIKDNQPDRIGITLTNFMNKTDKLLPILNKYLKLIDTFNIDKVEKLHDEIKAIINNFELKNIPNIDEELFQIHQRILDEDEKKSYKRLIDLISKIKNEKNIDTEILKTLKFMESLFHLKNDYYNYNNLLLITVELLNKEDDVQQYYNWLLLNLIQKLENKLNLEVNETLKILIHQIFKIFYKDYYFASNPSNLFDFLSHTSNNMKANPYNKYYQNIYKYISSIQHEAISRKINKEYDRIKRFKKFSLQEMSKIFIDTLIKDIIYISDNYNNVPDVISNTIETSKNTYKYKISSFYELFYISRYYIEKDGNNLTKCNLCGRYFITQGKVTEKHCRRIYKENLNCCEYAIKYFRETKSFSAEISDTHNKIRSMLKKRDASHNTKQFDEFNTKYKDIKNKIDLENISRDEKAEKLLNWINLEYKNLKNIKK